MMLEDSILKHKDGFPVLVALTAPIQKLFILLLIQNTMPQFCSEWIPSLRTPSNINVPNQ